MKKAVIFANGKLQDGEIVRACIHAGDFLIAADGGNDHMKRLGLKSNLLVGDLDSLPAIDQQWLVSENIEIKSFPSDKDQTDLELALMEAVHRGFSRILIVAALGGRLDQTLGNISLLAHPALKDCEVSLEDGLTQVWLLTPDRYPQGLEIEGLPGEKVSLIAFQSEAKGVFTDGLKYPLFQENLKPFETRGISNEMVNTNASVRMQSGQLLVLHSRNDG